MQSRKVFLDMNFYPLAMYHYSLSCRNHKWMDNQCDPNLTDIAIVKDNIPQGWVFKIDGEIPVELHESVKDFVFPGFDRPEPRDSLRPYNISLVFGSLVVGDIHWIPSKQKLIADRPSSDTEFCCTSSSFVAYAGKRFRGHKDS